VIPVDIFTFSSPAGSAILVQLEQVGSEEPPIQLGKSRKALVGGHLARNKVEKNGRRDSAGVPFVDLFCGAGGLSCGFEMAGFKPIYALDYDEHACATFALNHPGVHVVCDSVENVTPNQIFDAAGSSRIPLVIGGPNCQGVSLRGKRNPDDPKNLMFFHFKRLIEGIKPDWFVMENVPGLLHRHNQGLVSSIFEAFHSIGYRCGAQVLLAADYGVPQLRYRLILVGNRHGQEVVFPDPTHKSPIEYGESSMFGSDDERPVWLTALDAIGDLPVIENGGGQQESFYPPDPVEGVLPYQELSRENSPLLLNHISHKSCESNIRLVKYIPAGKNWKAIPERIRPARFKHVALKDHTTTYGRLAWDAPARTITTYFNNISSGAFTHPEQHRGISVREGARFQGFPDRYGFRGTLARQYRQVGNAVPPLMAVHVARTISSMMGNSRSGVLDMHPAAIDYSASLNTIRIHRPVQGMRFNLDKYLVRS
jgi:DNA (cytosine-5)-methyltransferase 1